MLTDEKLITEIDALPDSLKQLILRELARLASSKPGLLAGSEYEMVLALKADTLNPVAFLAEQDAVFKKVIERFNHHLENHPEIADDDKAAWRLVPEERGIKPGEVIDIISYYGELTSEERVDLLQAIETMLLLIHQRYGDGDCLALVEKMRQSDFTIAQLKEEIAAITPHLRQTYGHLSTPIIAITAAADDRIHPDVSGTFEGVTPPFTLNDPRAHWYAEVLDAAVKDVPPIRPVGSIFRGSYSRLGTTSTDSVLSGLPDKTNMAFARFGVIGQPTTGNQLLESMKDAGQHSTVGIIPERLNDTYRVLHGLLPMLSVLQQNSALEETRGLALRTIRGSWLGQSNQAVRARAAFPDPSWTSSDVIAWWMLSLLKAPTLGKMHLNRSSGVVSFQPTEISYFKHAVREVLEQYDADERAKGTPLSDTEMEKLWNAQTKVWGPLRLRGLLWNDDHYEVLIEVRVADTADPLEGLNYQRFLQAIVQDNAVLNAVQDYFERHSIIPTPGRNTGADECARKAKQLHETGLQAMTGRTADGHPTAMGFDTPYHGLDERITIGDSLQAIAAILRKNGHSSQAEWLESKRARIEHAQHSVAHHYAQKA